MKHYNLKDICSSGILGTGNPKRIRKILKANNIGFQLPYGRGVWYLTDEDVDKLLAIIRSKGNTGDVIN